jgi:hypothetical protein
MAEVEERKTLLKDAKTQPNMIFGARQLPLL